jgi:ribosomal protein L32
MAKSKGGNKRAGGPDDICPQCGLVGGAETITDLPGAGTRAARKELLGEIGEERSREEHVLEAEGKSSGDVCPHCGYTGGAETITDLPPVHLREAHRKLKAEISEAKEERKREGH